MMASAAWRAFVGDLASNGAHARTPRSTFFIGISTPIRPVEQTSTSPSLNFRAAAAVSVIRFSSAIPLRPVHAFAFPEFTPIARAKYFAARGALHFPDARQTRLPGNNPLD